MIPDKEQMKDDSIELAGKFLNEVINTMEVRDYPRAWVPYAVNQAVAMFMVGVEKQDRCLFIGQLTKHLMSVIDAEYEQLPQELH